MGKVTSKLQISIPKALADRVGVQPGDEVEWSVAGSALRVTPARAVKAPLSVEDRLRIFDATTKRLASRKLPRASATGAGRGWKREDLYRRGRSR